MLQCIMERRWGAVYSSGPASLSDYVRIEGMKKASSNFFQSHHSLVPSPAGSGEGG